MPDAAHSPARFLAPLALVLSAVAFFAILLSADTGDDDSPADSSRARQQTTGPDNTTETQRRQPRRRNYTVKAGDTLDGIAVRTGVEAERLQELNPDLDPQTLVVGQRIKLRE